MAYKPANPNGQALAADSAPVVIASDQSALPVSIATLPSVELGAASLAALETVNIGNLPATQPVSGTVAVSNMVAQGLTDAELRLSPVAVSGTVTANTGLSQPLTDAQLRAAAVSVSLASVPSHPVTNAGTFAVQATGTVELGAASLAALETVSIAGTVPVSGTFYQATQPVSAASLPLPTGASTEATLSTLNAKVPASLTVKAASTAAIATDPALVVAISPNNTVPVSLASVPTHGVTGTFWQATQPVSLASVPSHPVTNAGTFAVQATGTVELGAASLAALENINVTVPGTIDLGTVSLTALETVTVAQTLPGNLNTLASGSVTTAAPAYTTGTNNALSLNTTGGLRVDGSGVTQPVSLASVPSHPVTNAGTFAVQASGTVELGATTLAALETTSITGTVAVSAASLPLPTGAATSALQTTGNTALSAIQVAAEALDNAVGVDGAAVATGMLRVGGTDGTNNQTISVTAAGLVNVADGGGSLTVDGTFWQATQPVSAASLPLPTGAATETTLSALNTKVPASLTVKAASTAAVATDPALVVAISPNNTVPVSLASVPSHPVTNAGTFAVQASGTVELGATTLAAIETTSIAGTVAVSAASLPLPTGAATETTLAAMNTKTLAAGQAVMAASSPVVIASNQSAIPVSGTFWQATQPVSIASMPSTPVTGTFWQATQPVSLASVPSHAVTLASTTITSLVPGVAATSLGKQTDSAAGATDTGVAILAIRDDALTTLTPIDGDYTMFRVGSTGRLWTSATIDAALPAGTNSIGTVEIGATSLTALETTNAVQSGTWTVGLSAAQTLATVTTVGTVTNLSQLGGTAIAMNTGVRAAGVQRVTIATDDVVQTRPASNALATLANVAGSAASVTLQASNTARKGWMVHNDSTAILYLKLGSTAASTTSYTVKLIADAYYELPFNYTGQINGIWASATGNARVTEIT